MQRIVSPRGPLVSPRGDTDRGWSGSSFNRVGNAPGGCIAFAETAAGQEAGSRRVFRGPWGTRLDQRNPRLGGPTPHIVSDHDSSRPLDGETTVPFPLAEHGR
jgi:hypothetical protein